MSLLRLLTSGKSLIGLKKSEGRYSLPGSAALPRFGSKKNPFRATVLPERGDARETRSPAAAPVPSADAPELRNARSDSRMSGGPEVESPEISEAKESKDKEQAPETRNPQRSNRLRAFLLWGRAKKSRSAFSGNGQPLVQGELSLDSVKVVRNDLSESDLEVVRVDRPSTKAVPTGSEDEAVSATPAGWGRGVGRLFGAGKS